MRPRPPRTPLTERPVILLALALAVASPAAAQPPANPDPAALLDRAKQVLAPLEGDVRLSGLREPVEVVRDRWGIAHISAKNADDLFFAQGFVVAQDRLFQIDLWRRQAAGEMAEAFGPGHVEADRFARLLKYRGDMGAEWASYAPDARAIATAFTAGIDRLPVEFALLGHRPKKWRPEDVLGRMSGVYMSQNFRTEVQRARLVAAVGVEKARWLAPVDPPREYAPHSASTTSGRSTTASWPGTARPRSRRRSSRSGRRATTGSSPAAGPRPASRSWPATRTGPPPCRRCGTSSTCARPGGTSSGPASRACRGSPSGTTTGSPGGSPSSGRTRPTSTSRRRTRRTRRSTRPAASGSG